MEGPCPREKEGGRHTPRVLASPLCVFFVSTCGTKRSAVFFNPTGLKDRGKNVTPTSRSSDPPSPSLLHRRDRLQCIA